MSTKPLRPGETELIIRGNKEHGQISYHMHPEDWNVEFAERTCMDVAQGINPKLKLDNQVTGSNGILTYWSLPK